MEYPNYLVTPKGYYFEISGAAKCALSEADLAQLESVGCIFCADEVEMCQKHIEVMNAVNDFEYGVDVEDLLGTHYCVCFHLGQFLYMCDRGFLGSFYEDEDVECRTVSMLAQALMEFEL